MNSLDCQIGGKPGEISAHALRTAVQQTVGLLDEYDAGLYDWRVLLCDGMLPK